MRTFSSEPSLGKRVREILEAYAEQAIFFVPEVAYAEAEEHVPTLVMRRRGDPDKAIKFLGSLRGALELIGTEVYGDFESTARERLGDRDPEDWPILASALAIGCPIWTGHRFLRVRRAHLDDEPSIGVFARASKIGERSLVRMSLTTQ